MRKVFAKSGIICTLFKSIVLTRNVLTHLIKWESTEYGNSARQENIYFSQTGIDWQANC
ncbi:hypothetical protein NTG1052_980008 [Candidatus Nitrotoga sp. 1052]|nr:hypothetical protein NTG1052_980008 [Candidatus Nitrotoga sp. 1052]